MGQIKARSPPTSSNLGVSANTLKPIHLTSATSMRPNSRYNEGVHTLLHFERNVVPLCIKTLLAANVPAMHDGT